jgi:hypothetical protein
VKWLAISNTVRFDVFVLLCASLLAVYLTAHLCLLSTACSEILQSDETVMLTSPSHSKRRIEQMDEAEFEGTKCRQFNRQNDRSSINPSILTRPYPNSTVW